MFCTNCGKDNPDTNKFCLQCGQPLAGAARGPAAGQPAVPAQPRRSLGRLPLILGGLLLLVALAAAAYFLLPGLLGGGGAGGREMLLAAPNRSGDVDLSVLRLGDDLKEEAVVIAEDVRTASGSVWAMESSEAPARWLYGDFGSFLPGSDRLTTFFIEDDEMRLMEYVIGAEAPTEIISDAGGRYVSTYLSGSGDLFIVDFNGSPRRCYLAAPGGDAERVARGDSCYLSGDGARIVIEETNSDGELTLTMTDLDGGNEVTVLDDVTIENSWVSTDSSRVAYLERVDDGQSIVLLNAAGEELFESDPFAAFGNYGFAGTSNTLYFVGDNGDGEWELHTSAGDGPLAASPALRVLAARDGKTLAVLAADEDGAGEVSLINLESGESVEVFSGDDLQTAMASDRPWLLTWEQVDDELKLIASDMTGANPVTLFDESDYVLADAQLPRGDDRLFLELNNMDGETSLFVAPLNGSPGFFVVEDWYEAMPLNLSSDTLLLTGREDARDDPILYAITLRPDAELIELDDTADEYGYAVIAPDGRTALYNATVGNNPDDVVVRQARLDGETSPEDLYDEMWLAAARWAEINPFRVSNVSWSGAGELALALHSEAQRISDNFHAGAITRASSLNLPTISNENIYGDLLAFEGRVGQRVEIEVYGQSFISSNLDPLAILLDADMNDLTWDDDGGSGLNARINMLLPEDGIYYLVVTSPSRASFGEGNEMAYEVWMTLD